MGRLLSLSQSNSANINTASMPKPQLKIGSVSLSIVTFILVLVLALFYLAQSNQKASASYKIQNLESQKTEFSSDLQRLELESARLRSLSAIQENEVAKEMVPQVGAEYVK